MKILIQLSSGSFLLELTEPELAAIRQAGDALTTIFSAATPTRREGAASPMETGRPRPASSPARSRAGLPGRSPLAKPGNGVASGKCQICGAPATRSLCKAQKCRQEWKRRENAKYRAKISGPKKSAIGNRKSKILEDPTLSDEQRQKILDGRLKIIKTAAERDA